MLRGNPRQKQFNPTMQLKKPKAKCKTAVVQTLS